MSSTPAPRLNAEIVTTGTEILLGEIVDTNAAWIAQQLRDVGVNLYYKTTVGDNEARLRAVLELGVVRSDVIIVTGGLGPTADDITRAAVASAVGQPLVLHPPSLEAIRARFRELGAPMTLNNERQAYLPAGATVIENPVGTAPAFRVERGRATIIALPGVPREMKYLMTHAVLPYLQVRNGELGTIRRRVLRTIGVGESTIDDRLGELMYRSNPTVGLAAHAGQVDVRITASAPTAAAADALLDSIEAEVRERIGGDIYSTTPGEPFVAYIQRLLEARNVTVALVDGSSERALIELLREAAGEDAAGQAEASRFSVDERENAQSYEAGPRAAAERAAARTRATAQASYGLALLSDPAGEETYVALAGPEGVVSRRLAYSSGAAFNQRRAANQALILLWRTLAGETP